LFGNSPPGPEPQEAPGAAPLGPCGVEGVDAETSHVASLGRAVGQIVLSLLYDTNIIYIYMYFYKYINIDIHLQFLSVNMWTCVFYVY
jgi:hypothetical protein